MGRITDAYFTEWWQKHGAEFIGSVCVHEPDVKDISKAMFVAGMRAAAGVATSRPATGGVAKGMIGDPADFRRTVESHHLSAGHNQSEVEPDGYSNKHSASAG